MIYCNSCDTKMTMYRTDAVFEPGAIPGVRIIGYWSCPKCGATVRMQIAEVLNTEEGYEKLREIVDRKSGE